MKKRFSASKVIVLVLIVAVTSILVDRMIIDIAENKDVRFSAQSGNVQKGTTCVSDCFSNLQNCLDGSDSTEEDALCWDEAQLCYHYCTNRGSDTPADL